MYHVSAQGVDERMINVHYYYTILYNNTLLIFKKETHLSAFDKEQHVHKDVVKYYTVSLAELE